MGMISEIRKTMDKSREDLVIYISSHIFGSWLRMSDRGVSFFSERKNTVPVILHIS